MRSNSKNRGSIDETSKSDRGARSIPRFLRADRREGRFSKEADVSLPNTSQKGHLLSSDQIKPCLFFFGLGGMIIQPGNRDQCFMAHVGQRFCCRCSFVMRFDDWSLPTVHPVFVDVFCYMFFLFQSI